LRLPYLVPSQSSMLGAGLPQSDLMRAAVSERREQDDVRERHVSRW